MNLSIVIGRVIKSSMCVRLTKRIGQCILLVLELGESIGKRPTNHLKFCLKETRIMQSLVARCTSCGRRIIGSLHRDDVLIDILLDPTTSMVVLYFTTHNVNRYASSTLLHDFLMLILSCIYDFNILMDIEISCAT